jgi:hypothetical protein
MTSQKRRENMAGWPSTVPRRCIFVHSQPFEKHMMLTVGDAWSVNSANEIVFDLLSRFHRFIVLVLHLTLSE